MKLITPNLNELRNLSEVAYCHKNHCNDENCGISLWLLKQTAERLINYENYEDYKDTKEEVEQIFKNWPK